MFKNLGKNLGAAKGLLKGGRSSGDSKSRQQLRYKFDVQVVDIEGLPDSVKKVKIVWARSTKSKETDTKPVRQGIAVFKQTLSQTSSITMTKDDYEAKEFTFKVQVPRDGSDTMVTVGKTNVDMSEYVDDQTCTQRASVPISIKVGAGSKALLKLVVTTTPLGPGGSDDGRSMISGTSGVTDQDLNGFDGSSGKARVAKSTSSADDDEDGSDRGSTVSKTGRNVKRPTLPTTAEEEEPDCNDDDEDDGGSSFRKTKPGKASTSDPFSKKVAGAAPKKPAAAAPKRPVAKNNNDDDDSISPMSSDLDDEPKSKPTSGSNKGPTGLMQKKAATPDPRLAAPVERDKIAEEEAFRADRSALFGGAPAKPAKPSSSKAAASSAKAGSGGGGGGGMDEDGARNALFSSSKPAAGKSAPMDDDGARDALFSSSKAKPKAGAAAVKGVGAFKAAPSLSEADDDDTRASLFAPSKPKAVAPKPPAGSKATPSSKPTSDSDEDDNDSARSGLFNAASSAKAAPKRPAVKVSPPSGPAPGSDDMDEDAARGALFAAAPAKKAGGTELKRPPRPPPARQQSSEDDSASHSDASSEEAKPPPRFKPKMVAEKKVEDRAKAAPPPPPPPPKRATFSSVDYDDDDEDEEDELGIAAPPKGPAASRKGAAAASSSSKSSNPWGSSGQVRGSDAGGAGSIPFGDNAFGKSSKKSTPAPSKGANAFHNGDADEFGDDNPFGDDAFGGKSSNKPPAPSPPAAAPKGKGNSNPFGDDDFGDDNPFGDDAFGKKGAKKGVPVAAAAAVGAAAGRGLSSAKESSAEAGKLRQEVAALQRQLDAASKREAMLNKDLETYQSQVRKLEAKLEDVDVDPSEMFAQMSEMEQRCNADMGQQAKEHAKALLALRSELELEMERQAKDQSKALLALRSELEAAEERDGGGGNEDEVEELQAELEDRCAELSELRAELDLTLKQLASERVKLKEANDMIDQSMVLATSSSKEKRALNDEVDRLRGELAEAVATAGGRKADLAAAAHLRSELKELHDEVERSREEAAELREENDDLKKRVDRLGGELAEAMAAAGGRKADAAAAAHLRVEVEELHEEVAGLRDDNADLKKKLAAATAAAATAVAAATGVGAGASASALACSRSRSRGASRYRQPSDSGDDMDMPGAAAGAALGAAGLAAAKAAVAAANKDKERLESELEASNLMVTNLVAQVARLESFCEEVEQQGATESAELEQRIAGLERQLVSAQQGAAKNAELQEHIDDLERQLAAGLRGAGNSAELVLRIADLERQLAATSASVNGPRGQLSMGPSQGNDGSSADMVKLQDELADAQLKLQRVSRERSTLTKALDKEEQARDDLEDQLKAQLEEYGDDEALETVVAFEQKYDRIKQRYKMLEASSQDEIDELAAQLTGAQQAVHRLQKQLKDLQLSAAAAPSRSPAALQSHNGHRDGPPPSDRGGTLPDYDAILQKLVDTQFALGRMGEGEAILRRDLARAKEVNMKLASKLTQLEGALQYQESPQKGKGKK